MAKLYINEKNKKGHINAEIYGNFSEHLGRCIYEGIYVGENSEIPNTNGMRNDVVAALREIKLPVLRWPGGCFADEYHWKDGIGPKENRKKMINTHWGGVTEDNSFGTHEFFELCEQIGCKTYINGNVGSGTVQEMSEWVEYMTFDGISPMADLRKQNGHEKPWKVDYFGVGNENWGCGGNMTPSHYANLYRQYQTYVRNYDSNSRIFKVCGGPNIDDTYWTDQVLKTCYENTPKDAHGFMDGLSMHYYVVPECWENKGSATDFDEKGWYKTLSKALYIETLINHHTTIMDKYDPEKKIGLICDEWGTWFNCEPGTKIIGEENDFMVPNLQESVSVDEDGIITITLNNLSISESEEVEISFTECKPNQVTAKILVNKMNAYNTFEQPEQVKQEDFAAFTVTEKGINFTIPACSIIQLRVK